MRETSAERCRRANGSRRKNTEDQPAPQKILAEEKTEIGEPGRTKKALSRTGRQYPFKGPKYQDQKHQTEQGRDTKCKKRHDRGPMNNFILEVEMMGKAVVLVNFYLAYRLRFGRYPEDKDR